MDKKHLCTHLLAFCVLAFGYFLCRYLLFSLHGLIDITNYLALLAALVLVLSFLFGGRIVPIISSLAYPVCFAFAVIFQKDGFDLGGGRINNLWSIWVISFCICVLISLCLEAFYSHKNSY